MIQPGNINVFDSTVAQTNNSFYNGTFNFKQIDHDPLVTGYAVIVWDKIPEWVNEAYPGFKQFTQKNFLGLSGLEDFQLETQEYNYGFNNNAYHTATGITKNNAEFTLTHKELSGSPIKNMYQHWVTNIFDPETGISPYGVKYGYDFAAKNHTGSLMYIVLRPDVNNYTRKNIEFAAYYTNVFPKKVPLSHFEYQQGTRDHVQIEIPFSGVLHLSAQVDNYARTLLEKSYSYTTMGMFDPTQLNQGAENITVFETDICGSSQQSGSSSSGGQSL